MPTPTSLSRACLALLGAAVSAAPARAGDASVDLASTVVSAIPSSTGPFSGVQIGDAVTVHLEVFAPGTDVLPGEYTRYNLDLAACTITVGGGTTSFVGGTLALFNNNLTADGFYLGSAALAGGGQLSFGAAEASGTIFASTDVLAESGSWGPATWATYSFAVNGGGNSVGFAAPTVVLSQLTIGSTPFCDQVPNSTGIGGTIGAQGTAAVAANDVTLVASNVPQGQFGIFLTSRTQGMAVVGAGTLCLGGSIGRFAAPAEIQMADAAGTFRLRLDLLAVPQGSARIAVLAGETWHYQAWYRDVPAAGGFGFTQATSILYR